MEVFICLCFIYNLGGNAIYIIDPQNAENGALWTFMSM